MKIGMKQLAILVTLGSISFGTLAFDLKTLDKAKNGDAKSQYLYSVYLKDNQEWPKTKITDSTKWLLKSAANGYAKAQYDLGMTLRRGYPVEQNNALAHQWIKHAASQGLLEAILMYSLYYVRGTDHPLDLTEAGKWLRVGADHGHYRTILEYGQLLITKNYEGYNPASAVPWLKIGAAKEEPQSTNALGVLMYNGIGIEQNKLEASKLFRIAADYNHWAMYNYGQTLYTGDAGYVDLVTALNYMEKASKGNNKEALKMIPVIKQAIADSVPR